jgi:hypothetical protein
MAVNKQLTPQDYSNLARSDGVHDFENDGPKDPQHKEIFDVSVPVPSTMLLDEPGSMEFLFGKPWKNAVKQLPPGGLKINDVTVSVRPFRFDDADTGDMLADKLGISENGIGLIVDVNHHSFMDRLKRGEQKPSPRKIYYLMTPEVVNDPAGKPNIFDPLFRQKTGLDIVTCIESGNTPGIFPGNQSPFFSTYSLTLSPIRTVKKKQVVDLEIRDDTKNKRILVEDSKQQNAKNFLKDIVSSVFRKIQSVFTGSRDQEIFRIASAWVQKRSGDWLQAIASTKIQGRTFVRYNPDTKANEPITLPQGLPVYFTTHDQIAAAYALSIGCNVIFFSSSLEEESFIFTRGDTMDYTQFYVENTKPEDVAAAITAITSLMDANNRELATREESMKNFFTSVAGMPTVDILTASTQTLFKIFVEFAYIYKTQTSHQELLNGLNSKNPGTTYLSLLNAKKVAPLNLKSIQSTDVYKSAASWTWTRDPIRTRNKEETVVGKSDLYQFLVYIGQIPDTYAFKEEFARGFLEVSKSIGSHPAVQSLPDRTREKAVPNLTRVFAQAYMHLHFEETQEQTQEYAQLLLTFASTFSDILQPIFVDEEPKPMEIPEASDILMSFSRAQYDLPALYMLNMAANVVEKRRRDDESEEPSAKRRRMGGAQGGIHPLSPIFTLMYALDANVNETLEFSPDLSLFGRYIKFIEAITANLDSPLKRYAVWELLFSFNSTQEGRQILAQTLGISYQDYLPFALISSSLSGYLFHSFANYELTPIFANTKQLMQTPEIQAFFRKAVAASQSGATLSYTQILETYQGIRENVFFTMSRDAQKPALQLRTGRTVESQPILQKIPGVTVGTGRKTYRKKPKRSKSSRHTKRVRRSGRATKSEK